MNKHILFTLGRYVLVFAFFFFVFGYIYLSIPGLLGHDAYYHIKHSWLLRTEGIIEGSTNFPWMQLTVLSDNPSDGWFGYHALLMPFTVGDLVVGSKIAGIIIAALFYTFFYWTLRRLKVAFPLLWVFFLFLFIDAVFSYRLLFSRPQGISMLLFPLSMYLVAYRKYLWVLLVAFIWSFMSIESVLLIALALIWATVAFVVTRKIDWKMVLAPVMGLCAALFVRPDFPNNILWVYDTFRIVFLRFTGVRLEFGVELALPFSATSPLHSPALLILPAMFAAYVLLKIVLREHRAITAPHLFFIATALAFGFLAVTKSMRFIEEWAPATVLAAAVLFTDLAWPRLRRLLKELGTGELYKKVVALHLSRVAVIVSFLRKAVDWIKGNVRAVGVVCVVGVLVLVALRAEFLATMLNEKALPVEHIASYESAAAWLSEHTAPGTTIVNRPWHSFPFLFFYNHQNYYAAGMDPALMYLKSPETYWLWRNMTDNELCDRAACDDTTRLTSEHVSQLFKNTFDAEYLLLELPPGFLERQAEASEHVVNPIEEFRKLLATGENSERVFDQGRVEIYHIDTSYVFGE